MHSGAKTEMSLWNLQILLGQILLLLFNLEKKGCLMMFKYFFFILKHVIFQSLHITTDRKFR